jgi:hypothetical protein
VQHREQVRQRVVVVIRGDAVRPRQLRSTAQRVVASRGLVVIPKR